MDDHKMKLLELMKKHGETIHKMADGGVTTLGGPTAPPPNSSPRMQGVTGPLAYTGGGAAFNALNNLTQNHFQATGAAIQPGTNAAQLNQAYDQAQTGIGHQENFLNALQAQNGVQNQSDVYNQMQGVVNGTGPNPAQAMLNNATGANVANQAALMASQRGASANPGLIAREAAMQGAGIQQNAAGQGAALQANQSLNALNAASGIAQNQVNQQGQATQGFNTAVQNEQNILQAANSGYNNAQVGMQSNINNVNGMISQGNQQAGNALTGGIIKGISSAFGGGGGGLFAEGGEVQANVGGGNYSQAFTSSAPDIGSMGTSANENFLADSSKKEGGKAAPKSSPEALGGGGGSSITSDLGSVSKFATMAADGGLIEQPKSQAAKHLNGTQSPPQQQQVASSGPTLESILGLSGRNVAGLNKGGPTEFLGALKTGGKVPGKPKVGGAVDTEKNDTVPALLSAGEVVLPRSVTQSEDPVAGAAQFVAALMKKKKMNQGGVACMAEGGEAAAPDYLTLPGQEQSSDVTMPDIQVPKTSDEEVMKQNLDNRLGQIGNFANAAKNILFSNDWVGKAKNGEITQPMEQKPESAQGLGETRSPGASAEMPTNVQLGQPAAAQNPVQSAGLTAQSPDGFKYDPYQGFNTQLAGVAGEANAAGQVEQEKADLLAKHTEDLQKINEQGQAMALQNQTETQAMIEDMKKGHIDPKAYINNMSSGQKLSTAIGLILGGIGGGIDRSGQNPAMEFLNQQINRDVEAQVKNRDNKLTIFNAMEKQYGNKKDALNMTHAFYLAKLQNDINTAAAKSGNKMAIARAQQVSGPIQTELQKLHYEVGMRQAAMNGNGGQADPAVLVRYLVPQEHQKKAFEEIEVAQNTSKNAPHIMKAFWDAANKVHSVDFVPGMQNVDQKSFHALLGPTFQDVEGTVRQAAMDNMFSNVTPQFGDSKATINKKAQATQNYLDYKSSAPTAKGFGIDLRKFRSTNPMSAAGFKKRN